MKVLNLDMLKLNKNKFIISSFVLVVCGMLNMFSIQGQQVSYVNNSNFPQMTSFEYFLNIQGDAVGFLHMLYFLTITLAIGDIFIKEKKSSVLYFSLVRTDIKKYIREKIVSIGFTSVLFILFSQIILLIISMILYSSNSPSISQDYVLYINKEFFSNHPLIYCFIVIFNSCIMAFAYSCFTIFISIIFNNIYVILTLPYLINVGVSIFMTSFPMYFGKTGYYIYNLSPTILAGAYISDSISFIYPILYWLILSLIFYKLSVVAFENRFKNEKLF